MSNTITRRTTAKYLILWSFLAGLLVPAVAVYAEEKTPLRLITARETDQNPDKVKAIIDGARRATNPTDKAIIRAVKAQLKGRNLEAVDKWVAVAKAGGRDDINTALAYYSAAYLIKRHNPDYETNRKVIKKIISFYDEILKLLPEYAKWDIANALYNRAREKHKLGEYQQAIYDYDQSIKKAPDNADNAETFYARGRSYMRLGNYRKGIDDLSSYLDLKPNDTYALYTIGAAQMELGEFRQAIRYFDTVLKIDPSYFYALNERGRAKKMLGDFNGAAEDFRKTLKYDPDNETAIRESRNLGSGN